MRSGAQSLTHFLWFVVPAFAISGSVISLGGATIAGLVTIYIVVKVCNTIDRAEIRADSKPQLKGRASRR